MKEDSPAVKIAGIVGGISVAVVAVICVFVRQQVWVAAAGDARDA